MISEADHIHNKAIFDCVNEAMNLVRPYGVHGELAIWSQQAPSRNANLIEIVKRRPSIETVF